MSHKTKNLLFDISLSCQEISDFIDDKSFEYFYRRSHAFEIIGEPLHRLSRIEKTTLAQKIPEYRKFIDFRNIIAHGYDIIDEAAMWDLL